MRHLSDDEIDTVLLRNGIGVLSLYDGTYPYPLPMSFGYDGSTPLFVMQFGTTGETRKQRCLADDPGAGFAVYEYDDADEEWRSVVITGDLVEIPDDETEHAFAALTANAEFPPDLSVWGAPLQDATLSLYELDIDEVAGRAFSMGVD